MITIILCYHDNLYYRQVKPHRAIVNFCPTGRPSNPYIERDQFITENYNTDKIDSNINPRNTV